MREPPERLPRKLAPFGRALLMLGGGEACAEATAKAAARLARDLSVQVVAVPEGKQPDLLSSDNIRRILNPLY